MEIRFDAGQRPMTAVVWAVLWTVLGIRWSAGQSCGPRVSARFLLDIPCDMSHNNVCNVPGSAYPWHAVRRYIFENQGLMRRMYGDQRHSIIISSEVEERRLRYENPNVLMQTHRSAAGRSVSRVRPNSRFAARRKTPKPASRPPPLPAATSSTPSQSAGHTSPSSTPAPVLTTPGGVTKTTVTYHLETPSDDNGTEPQDDSTTTVPSATEDSETSTTPWTNRTTTVVDDEDEPSYAAGETLTKEPGPPDESYAQGVATEKPFVSKLGPVVDNNSIDIHDDEGHVEEEAPDDDVKAGNNPQATPLRKGINACPVKQEVLAPYWANNTRGEVLALLNVYPFEQYIHTEKCAFENHQMFCRDGCRCEQQFRLHRLLAFDPRNECRGIFADWFRFPSCCVCICYDLGTSLYRAGRQASAADND